VKNGILVKANLFQAKSEFNSVTIIYNFHFNEQHPARVGSLPSGAATRAFFYKTVFSWKKTVLVKSSARQMGS
jgi:hypothetical protein